jgi:hypothetical protein
MNPKPLRKILPIFLLLVLPGCAPVQTVAPSLSTPSPLATGTTVPPTVSPTSLPSPTPTQASTPTPASPWAEGIEVNVLDGEYAWGKWSPVSGELVTILDNHLIRLSSPDFTPKDLYSNATSFLWSQDGQSIYFSGPRHPDDKQSAFDSEERSGWVVDRDGRNPIQFQNNPGFWGKWFSWKGWVSPSIAVTDEYGGGGHYGLDLVDVNSQKMVASGGFFGGSSYPGKNYVAVDGSLPNFHPLVEVLGQNLPSFHLPDHPDAPPSGNIRVIPIDDQSNTRITTCYDGWITGTNRMLVDWDMWDPEKEKGAYALYGWDVDQNLVSKIVDNALSGKISPDGKTLAYITLQRDPPSEPSMSSVPDYSEDIKAYLHVRDLHTGKMILSGIPIIAEGADYKSCDLPHLTPSVEFSPDNRYLAIHSGQQIVADTDGRPSDRQDGEPEEYLSLLDLQSGKIVWMKMRGRRPSWSPDSAILLYESAGIWKLLDIKTMTLMQLTNSKISRQETLWSIETSWSYDSSYVMLQSKEEGINIVHVR